MNEFWDKNFVPMKSNILCAGISRLDARCRDTFDQDDEMFLFTLGSQGAQEGLLLKCKV